MPEDQPQLHLADNLKDAKIFLDVLVQPLLDAQEKANQVHQDRIEALVAPVVEQVQKMEGRVKRLESDQKKALLGWGIYSTGIGIACAAAWKWLTGKIHLS